MNGRTTDRNPQENCFQHNHTFGLWQVYSHFAEKIKKKNPAQPFALPEREPACCAGLDSHAPFNL